ncbi:putative adam protease adm-b [Rosellinia necatrix]|uniref:Disintegrin and metalloproteinase domain-containing protein B n=1 Tax=Rosellinia necatrix TaxID=77044 RepID=A0A1W2TI80_ROSNE|nr:putative adam protease adm-b [Rosellinia necatrix]
MRLSITAVAALLCTFARDSNGHSIKRNPLNYITQVDRPTLHAPSNRIHAHSSFDVTFLLHDERDKVRIELEPNHDVLPEGATVRYLGPDGAVSHEEVIDRREHRIYKGHAFVQHAHHSEWLNAGWARIAVLRDGPHPLFEGTFRVNGNYHHIQRASTYRQTRLAEDPEIHDADDDYMVVWRDTDIASDAYSAGFELKRDVAENTAVCSSDLLDFNNQLDHPVHLGLDLRDLASMDSDVILRRQGDQTTGGNGAGANLANTIGVTQGCPTSRKVALIGIATDCTYTAQFASRANVTQNVISMVSMASAVYESTFNISLGIQNLTISDASCPGSPPEGSQWNQPCSPSVTINDRLDLFSQWRGQFTDNNAYWTLLSTCATDAAVGLAWLGQLCTQGSSPNGNDTTAGANVVVRTNTEWQVFAHETGHTFGAYHDCTETTCVDGTRSRNQCCPLTTSSCDAGGSYIMNPSTGAGLMQFSPCSVGNICSAISRGSVNAACLSDNKNVVTISGSQCGNGIVEQGEDCDCGGETGCQGNSCCNPSTCKFTTNSVCDPANEDCCTDQCQFASNGTVCRTSSGTCDPQETCSGTSATCPADVKAPDGQGCGADGSGLKCASGQCTSRDLQCQVQVGGLTNNDDITACDANTCLIRCKSPNLPTGSCDGINQYFLDGTPCEGSGHCDNGVCKGSNTWEKIMAFFRDNKDIIIPVASVVGGLLLIAIAGCCCSCITRRTRRRKFARKTQPNNSWVGGYGNGNPGDNGWAASAMPSQPPMARSGDGRRGMPYSPQQQQAWGPPPRANLPRYA